MLVTLTQGKVAVIDDADWPLVAGRKWYAHRHSGVSNHLLYAHCMATENGKKCHLMMHRMILGLGRLATDPVFVDHIDGDGLNNRRENLRLCSISENQKNRRKSRHASGPYKAIAVAPSGRFVARITHNGKRIWLGTFDDAEQARLAYEAAAKKLHGEFARFS